MADRPWHRSLIKTGARLLLGGSRAHAQDGFPGLNIVRSNGPGEVFYRRTKVADLSSADRLRKQSGWIIHLVGSGPSIRDCDLAELEKGSAILLNGAIGLIGEQIAMPLAIAVEDERFVWRHSEMIMDKIRSGTICLFSVAVLRAISELDSRWLKDKTVILIDDIRKPYGGRRRSVDESRGLDFVRLNTTGSAGFSFAPDRGVFQGGSVAVSALQFALYCLPTRIGFLGIDISNAHEPRFYETSDETAFSGIARAEARILEHFVLAKQIASERGVTFVNHSPVSALLKYGFGYDARFAALSTI
ncbi:glycosyl transferase [Rhizobium calliandrae]|uniref:Glycosyl transferase n=1 Tax=Rhizobium calliandrae TaxID=1312182 RepID=A0ABT7KAZ8_9HYPH|nr:glycosyl transferase [Rhizobium calliandrae]MDL2405138.1 glycosyl transferase [Rhizobium calliandrae]